jgi:hypothetical protein
MHADAQGHARSTLNAQNQAKNRAAMVARGMGPQLLANSLAAAGNDPAKIAAAYADVGLPMLGQNVQVNAMGQQNAAPPPQFNLGTAIQALHNLPDHQIYPAALAAFLEHGMPHADADKAATAMTTQIQSGRKPKPTRKPFSILDPSTWLGDDNDPTVLKGLV